MVSKICDVKMLVCGSELFCAYIVLSQLFFLVLDTPCHVRHGGENVSHGVIMTNPPTHTQLTSSSISFPHSVVILPCFSSIRPQSESRISCFFPRTVDSWQYRKHLGIFDEAGFLMGSFGFVKWLPCLPQQFLCFSYSCRVIRKISFGLLSSQNVTVCLCS